MNIPNIHSDVYGNGVLDSLSANKKLAVVLLENGNTEQILAVSAVITGTNGAGGNDQASATYYPNGFAYAGKVLTIPTISYNATVSTVFSATAATAFAIIELDSSVQEVAKQAFEEAEFYKYPSVSAGATASSLGKVLIAGSLNNAPVVNQDSNFRLASTTITFSEVNAS